MHLHGAGCHIKIVIENMSLNKLKKDLRERSSPEYAKNLSWFFKTGPGEYGEGDVFLGVKMGDIRQAARHNKDLAATDLAKLLDSKYHEERMIALVIMDLQFKRGDDAKKTEIKNLYEQKMDRVNNWDLVDQSACRVYGEWFRVMGRDPLPTLRKLAKSRSMWRRRIAMLSTLTYISHGQFAEALEIADLLRHDKEDLIHKAVGWLLREIGKRDLPSEENFLLPRYKEMPRTMLRYAIERFPEMKRQRYLKGLM
jgi:3-methyladenine DNA glycosylase AlkD